MIIPNTTGVQLVEFHVDRDDWSTWTNTFPIVAWSVSHEDGIEPIVPLVKIRDLCHYVLLNTDGSVIYSSDYYPTVEEFLDTAIAQEKHVVELSKVAKVAKGAV